MRNLCVVLAYDGTDFRGWQRQPGTPTIQECLERSIERVIGRPTHVWGSGRTDAGVHALGQVANFKTDCPIPGENLLKALNDILPPTVRVKEVREVSEAFHARYDVRAKTYRYRILQAPTCSPFLWRFVWHYPYPLRHEQMAAAAQLIEGEHDFTSFAAVESKEPEARSQNSESTIQDSKPPDKEMVRRIFSSQLILRPRTSMLIYDVRGSGFLHHMVRSIVGTLVEVGRGKLAPEDITRILAARERSRAGPTAPAQGLCLVKVEY
jgi:tRNA pseudouridine38-40 synthase